MEAGKHFFSTVGRLFTDLQRVAWHVLAMRSVLVLVSAILFGVVAGYAWSAMASPKLHVRVPRAVEAKLPPTRETPADRQWEERADDNAAAAAPAPAATQA